MGLLAGAALSVIGGCGIGKSAKYRFRMTIEVETPQGLKTGSSVYEVAARTYTPLTAQEGSRGWQAFGQATIVELPSGPIFALLKTGDALRNDLAVMSMSALDPLFRNDVVESAERIEAGQCRHEAEVLRQYWPMMVRFRDINNPMTMELVDPELIGVQRITVETTDSSVTTGIQNKLPWLDHLDEYRSDRSNPFTSTLSAEIGFLRSL